jgi:class 3 adenylate cyclase/HAMP domain-containing protein
MSIRIKIILVILPLITAALVVAGVTSYFIATNSVTRVAVEFLDFKTAELEKYVTGQWRLLAEHDRLDDPAMVTAAQAGIEVYARSIIRSESEIILAVDPDMEVKLSTGGIDLSPAEKELLRQRTGEDIRTFSSVTLDGTERVAMGFPFEPFGWYFMVTEERSAFYRDVADITRQTALLIGIAMVLAVVLLLIFIRYITAPLRGVVSTMQEIIVSNNLSARVPVKYRDEIGGLSKTFNIMVEELEKAYSRIKEFAFDAVLAQKKETKIRNIFQKYVPQELIDKFFANPEGMLVGENRELAILFSDIRDFTTISESLAPDALVSSLNRYFSAMVDIIYNRGGVIDKYIGDAIMAFFGAPVQHDDDPYQSIMTALEMTEALETFNSGQREKGAPEFKMGVGLNYGTVTVGNIGTDRKMDYTVIGDMVNTASRLEGLTKVYRLPILLSETIFPYFSGTFPYRWVDKVAVKGKKKGLDIYTVGNPNGAVKYEEWELYNRAVTKYFRRDFPGALKDLNVLKPRMPGDFLISLYIRRCGEYISNPPAESWNGVHVMKSK